MIEVRAVQIFSVAVDGSLALSGPHFSSYKHANNSNLQMY